MLFESSKMNQITFQDESRHRRGDQRGRNTLFAIALAHIKAGERPDRHIVYALESPRAIEPRQGLARCKLAPAHSHIAVEGEQPWRWTVLLGAGTTCCSLLLAEQRTRSTAACNIADSADRP